jgi:aminopeptidase N
MHRGLLHVVLLLAAAGRVCGQFVHDPPVEGCSAKARSAAKATAAPSTSADPGIDAKHYAIRLTLVPASPLLVGHVTMTAVAVADTVRSVLQDLASSMVVDSVRAGGVPAAWTRFPEEFSVQLPEPVPRGGTVTVDTYYHGLPAPTGFGSFVFGSVNNAPWIWSLSQPYGARDWWPCKDHPIDKADSVRLDVTVPAGLKVGSNGILLAVSDNGDGTRTHRWVERYPIATYLVSVAAAEYIEFSDWFRYGQGDSMQVLNYVLPQSEAEARPALGRTVPMLDAFTRLFGDYPFLREKYGHAQFGRGGAMEHQTMTSTTTFNEDVIAHELGHQWFGDMITCANWQELWLNEGFATYSEALFREAAYGPASYREHINARMQSAYLAQGTLYVQDTSSVGELFRFARVYAKGATVLHMLRRVVGDTAFFLALRSYAADPGFRYGVATTADLRRVFEQVSGRDLGFFFDAWVFGEGYPVYSSTLDAVRDGAGWLATITLHQSATGSSPDFFAMPVDLRLNGPAFDTTVTVDHGFDGQTFTIRTAGEPRLVEIDPDEWILKEVIDPGGLIPATVSLAPNYPNPFNAGTTIEFSLPGTREVRVDVYDAAGCVVRTLDSGTRPAGRHVLSWDGRNDAGVPVATGAYFTRLLAGTTLLTRPMLLLR